MDITGGTREGNNLFYSFEEFSIPTGEEATFLNDTNIENIFTRVTGNAISNIDGILRAQGNANLFLMNPNGIIFGENASLNIGGSFVGTTANNIKFADGNSFSADDANPKPILTISVPVGLGFMGNEPGSIVVNGNGNQIISATLRSPTSVEDSTKGLSTDSGKTLALIGGDVYTSGGTIKTPGGKIEIGSIGSGSVSLTQAESGLNFAYDNATINRNIAISNLSLLNASGEGEGTISLTGSNVNLSNGSLAFIQNRGAISSGTLSINAPESLTLSKTSPDGDFFSAIRTEAVSTGKAGDISITTGELVLQGGGKIGANTYGDGKGGNMAIDAKNSAQLFESRSNSISASTFAKGDAGNIQLSTPTAVAS